MSTPAYYEKRISNHRLLVPADTNIPQRDNEKPLIVCFHGSGETCSPSWDDLAAQLVAETGCRVLLYDRGAGNLRAEIVAKEMWDFVVTGEIGDGLRGPYLLIAHSYGGAFARAFVQFEHTTRDRLSTKRSTMAVPQGHSRVMGLVLVETGQEGGLDASLDDSQINDTIMGERPVCVVRGNSLIGKWKDLEDRERALDSAEAESGAQRDALVALRRMLELMDGEDERLKKRQLGLSRRTADEDLPILQTPLQFGEATVEERNGS
ncbi:hypothetical protein F5Y18DRAFT_433538 [Xylariaceae sp. FL1019]|nr:hypothetical protein F5Y18DRAFT_433538 [Xylariaceae sp. FL1019]